LTSLCFCSNKDRISISSSLSSSYSKNYGSCFKSLSSILSAWLRRSLTLLRECNVDSRAACNCFWWGRSPPPAFLLLAREVSFFYSRLVFGGVCAGCSSAAYLAGSSCTMKENLAPGAASIKGSSVIFNISAFYSGLI